MNTITINTKTEATTYAVVDVQQPGPLAPVIVSVQFKRRRILGKRGRRARWYTERRAR